MTRRAVAFDRVAVFVSGLGLTALGCLMVAWRRGSVSPSGFQVTLATALSDPEWTWWSAGAGVLLVVVGLRWLATHHWPPRAGRVALPTQALKASADATSVADAAVAALAQDAAVVKCSGAATVERGVPTVTLTATVPARHGLDAGAAAADRVAETIAVMLGDTVAVRTVLRVDAKRGAIVR